MKNNKVYTGLIIGFLLLTIVVLAAIKINENFNGYIILPTNNLFYKKGNSLTKIKNKNIGKIKMLIKTENGLEEKVIRFAGNNIIFNENGIESPMDPDVYYGYSKNLKVKFNDFHYEDLSSEEIQKLKIVLDKNGITEYSTLTAKKMILDINNDGNEKTIYVATNVNDDTNDSYVFSIAYFYKDNKIEYIYFNKALYEDFYNVCVPSNSYMLDIGEKLLLFSCEYFDNIGSDIYIYDENLERFE